MAIHANRSWYWFDFVYSGGGWFDFVYSGGGWLSNDIPLWKPTSHALIVLYVRGVATITLTGSNFYATSTSRMALSIGSSSIAVAKWTSLTSILASVMPGLGIRHQPRIVAAPPVIFDAALTLTLGSSFSYDAPVVTNFAKEVHVFTF